MRHDEIPGIDPEAQLERDVQAARDAGAEVRVRGQVHDTAARHAGATDPLGMQKVDRLLARNALTSLGKHHPANVSRAERRRHGIRGALPATERELKARAVQRRTDTDA